MDLVHLQGLENRERDDSCPFCRWKSNSGVASGPGVSALGPLPAQPLQGICVSSPSPQSNPAK